MTSAHFSFSDRVAVSMATDCETKSFTLDLQLSKATAALACKSMKSWIWKSPESRVEDIGFALVLKGKGDSHTDPPSLLLEVNSLQPQHKLALDIAFQGEKFNTEMRAKKTSTAQPLACQHTVIAEGFRLATEETIDVRIHVKLT